MFYTYRQNNSGGYFRGPVCVIIEADSAEEANFIAEEKANLYFDGHGDCHCCGNRWHTARDTEGTEEPTLYGENILFKVGASYLRGDDCKIYYKDGREITVK